jgi:hypothetical protein
MKRCYVLGAGFSKACGLPLASELTAKVCDWWRHVIPTEVNPPPYPSEQEQNLMRSLFPCYDLKQRWPYFEKLLTALDEWEDYRASCGNDSEQAVRCFRKSLLKGLFMLLRERVDAARKADGLSVVKTFLKRACDERSTIVSFNWDCLLEVAARDLELGISYQASRYEERTVNKAVCVAKPHGSLNLSELPIQDYKEKEKNGHLFGVQREWPPEGTDTDTVIVRDPNPGGNRGVTDVWGPMVIAPTVKKSYQSPWIKLQWRVALDMVQNAQEIIVIGYSLPPTDIRPRLLLQLARFRRDGIAIRFVDPSKEKEMDDLKERVGEVVGDLVEYTNKRWEESDLVTPYSIQDRNK